MEDIELPDLPTPSMVSNVTGLEYFGDDQMRAYALADREKRAQAAQAAIHYPECWDTAAYPTVADALSEVYAHFQCTNQDTHDTEASKPVHDLYTDADPDRPDIICDRNGQVTLSFCKRCGKGEAQLDGPCNPVQAEAPNEAWKTSFGVRVGRDTHDCMDLIFTTVGQREFQLYPNEAAHLRDLLNAASIPGYPATKQAEAPTASNAERERYEAWVNSLYLELGGYKPERFGDEYKSFAWSRAWDAWQARAALAQVPEQVAQDKKGGE